MTYHYLMILRPASFCTLPDRVKEAGWDFVTAPRYINRPELPSAANVHGTIKTAVKLTSDECEHYGMRLV